jgi:hypothetical protein
MTLLKFVAAEIGASEPLPSKLTSASPATSAFRQRLPSRCLAMNYSVAILSNGIVKKSNSSRIFADI